MKRMTILVDFDHTLFDTQKMVEAIRSGDDKDDFGRFLFPDALGFLEYAGSLGDLILFTEGEPDFQKEKIDKSGIRKFFNRIEIYPSYQKMKGLATKHDKVNTLLIDDKPDFIDLATSLGFKTIRVQRGKYSSNVGKTKPNFSVDSLRQVVESDLLGQIR